MTVSGPANERRDVVWWRLQGTWSQGLCELKVTNVGENMVVVKKLTMARSGHPCIAQTIVMISQKHDDIDRRDGKGAHVGSDWMGGALNGDIFCSYAPSGVLS